MDCHNDPEVIIALLTIRQTRESDKGLMLKNEVKDLSKVLNEGIRGLRTLFEGNKAIKNRLRI